MRVFDKKWNSRVQWARRSPRRFALVLFFAVLLLAVDPAPRSARAQQTSYNDGELVAAALEVYNDFSSTPLPYLDSKQLQKLSRHQNVRVRKTLPSGRSEKGHREEVVGYRIVEQPRDRVWLAALDPEFQGSDLLTELRLEQNNRGSSLWFQHIALPWPIADRYWVIRLAKDLEINRSTQDFVWQHGWKLAEGGEQIARDAVASGRAGKLTTQKLEGAVYVPLNRGAWILFSLDTTRTLLVYRVSADVGGSIPESWIATFAMAQLDGLLDKVTEHAKEAWKSYDPKRYVIYDGAGHAMEARQKNSTE